MRQLSLIVITVSAISLPTCGIKPSGAKRRDRRNQDSQNVDTKAQDNCQSTSTTGMNLATLTNYNDDVKPMIATKCAWCHSATAKLQNRRRPYLTTYQAVKDRFDEIINEMRKNEMPPRNAEPRLEADDITTLEAWQIAGFPEQGSSDSNSSEGGSENMNGSGDGTTQPFVPGYVTTVQNFLNKNCLACHKPDATSPDLSSYELARLSATKSLEQMQAGLMPPGSPLDRADLDLFAKWIEEGMAEYDSGDQIANGSTTNASGSNQSDAASDQICPSSP